MDEDRKRKREQLEELKQARQKRDQSELEKVFSDDDDDDDMFGVPGDEEDDPAASVPSAPTAGSSAIDDERFYYTPVKTTFVRRGDAEKCEDASKQDDMVRVTEFPVDYLSPGGLAAREYDAVHEKMRCAKLNPRDSYNGYNDLKFAEVSHGTRVKNLPPARVHRIKQDADKLMRRKEATIKPYDRLLRKKYERWVIRKDINLPTAFPLVFAPHTLECEYSREHGIEIIITGTLESGHSCTVRVRGFRPYCYLEIPEHIQRRKTEDESDDQRRRRLHAIFAPLLDKLQDALRNNLKGREKGMFLGMTEDLISTTPCFQDHINCKEFRANHTSMYLKISAIHPCLIRPIRRRLQAPRGACINGPDPDSPPEEHNQWLPDAFMLKHGIPDHMTVMEAHIDYTVRFTTDLGLTTAGVWFIFDNTPVNQVPKADKISHSNLEITTRYENLRSASEEYSQTFKPKVLECKLDAEMEASDRFPQADTNPIVVFVFRSRFGALGEAKPEDPETLVNTPMPPGDTIRKSGCTSAVAFCLGEAYPSHKYDVLCFTDERELMLAMHEYLIVLQPDFLCGHASNLFDFPYAIMRAYFLNVHCWAYCTRMFKRALYSDAISFDRRGKPTLHRSKKNTKRGFYTPTTKWAGAVVWDMMNHAKHALMARTLSLNSLSNIYLEGKQKIDVAYSLIGTLMQNKDGMTLLVDYCNFDVVLLELLDDKVQAIQYMRDYATLCNIPMQALGDKTSTFRVMGFWLRQAQRFYHIATKQGPAANMVRSRATEAPLAPEDDPDIPIQLLKNAFKHHFVDHDREKQQIFFLQESINQCDVSAQTLTSYTGGKVLKPIRGHMTLPLITDDYTGLYPSIMQAFNLCFTTYIPAGKQASVCAMYGLDMKRDMYHIPLYLPTEDEKTTRPYIDPANQPSLVYPHVVEGIIKHIEEHLYNARNCDKKNAKEYYRAAKTETDPVLRALYLFKGGLYTLWQLLKKLMMNTWYGILGAPGAFHNKDLAKVITSGARQALEVARYNANSYARVSKGCPFNGIVIYGDTDSIFVVAADLTVDGKPWSCKSPEPCDHVDAETKEFLFTEAQKLCDMHNNMMPSTMNLAMEKLSAFTYTQTPKQYALYKSDGADKPFRFKASGNASVRRDGCKIKRDMCAAFLQKLVVQNDPQGAVDAVRAAYRRVRTGDVQQHELIVRSSLSKSIEEYGIDKKGNKMKSLPAQVVMAKKIVQRGGAPLRAGDRIYYIVLPGLPKAKVSDKVEDPGVAIQKGFTYDVTYYSQVLLNEAKKLMRALVDERSWAEKAASVDEDRRKLGRGCTDFVDRKEREWKKAMDKEVESVVIHGKEIDFSKRKPMSFYDLPARLQEDHPPLAWNWAGYGPDEEVPHVSEFNPSWLKTASEKDSLLREYNLELERAVDKSSRPEEEDAEVESFLDGVVVDQYEKIRVQDVDAESCTEGDSKKECAANATEMVNFLKVFSRSKVEKKKYSSVKQQAKKPEIARSSAFAKFVIAKAACELCGDTILKEENKVCKTCATTEKGRAKQAEHAKKSIQDIEDIITGCEKAEATCNKCIKDSLRITDPDVDVSTIVNGCPDYLCKDWAPLRKLRQQKADLHEHVMAVLND